MCSGPKFTSKFVWGIEVQEENWKSAFPEPRSEQWHVPELGQSSVPAGQRAWLAPSAPRSPAKSPTVLGREQATGLGCPTSWRRDCWCCFLQCWHMALLSAGLAWMKGILKNLGWFGFLHRGCKCSVLYLGVIQTILLPFCETTCSEQNCFIALVCSRLLFCF